MILNAGCIINVDAAADSAVVLMLLPQTGLGQNVKISRLSVEPRQAYSGVFVRHSVITSTCTVETPDEIAVHPDAEFTLIQKLPDETLQYLLPSRYCEADRLLKMATSITKGITPGYPQVEAIRSWIYRKLRYKYGPTQKPPRGNRIVIAYGRDAADVAQLSEYGPLKIQSMSAWVDPAEV